MAGRKTVEVIGYVLHAATKEINMPSVSMLAREEQGMHEPMYPKFNDVVTGIIQLLLPEGFDVTHVEDRVDTLEKIKQEYYSTGRIVVWAGGSDDTIFGEPSINWAFRAWHDLIHIQYNAPFDEAGEHLVMQVQQAHIRGFCDGLCTPEQTELFQRIIECEVDGQVEYHKQHNAFPADQRQFHRQWMKDKYGYEIKQAE